VVAHLQAVVPSGDWLGFSGFLKLAETIFGNGHNQINRSLSFIANITCVEKPTQRLTVQGKDFLVEK
jgi:hypothetical protein